MLVTDSGRFRVPDQVVASLHDLTRSLESLRALIGRRAVETVSTVNARFVPMLGEVQQRVDARAGRQAERFQAATAADPRLRVASAFAGGIVLGRVVNRLGH
jgi:ElaB/YqjD/DUF883 family membrane-anchored ribosome-binding protein